MIGSQDGYEKWEKVQIDFDQTNTFRIPCLATTDTPQVPAMLHSLDVIGLIAEHLIAVGLEATCASLNVTSQLVQDETSPTPWKFVMAIPSVSPDVAIDNSPWIPPFLPAIPANPRNRLKAYIVAGQAEKLGIHLYDNCRSCSFDCSATLSSTHIIRQACGAVGFWHVLLSSDLVSKPTHKGRLVRLVVDVLMMQNGAVVIGHRTVPAEDSRRSGSHLPLLEHIVTGVDHEEALTNGKAMVHFNHANQSSRDYETRPRLSYSLGQDTWWRDIHRSVCGSIKLVRTWQRVGPEYALAGPHGVREISFSGTEQSVKELHVEQEVYRTEEENAEEPETMIYVSGSPIPTDRSRMAPCSCRST